MVVNGATDTSADIALGNTAALDDAMGVTMGEMVVAVNDGITLAVR